MAEGMPSTPNTEKKAQPLEINPSFEAAISERYGEHLTGLAREQQAEVLQRLMFKPEMEEKSNMRIAEEVARLLNMVVETDPLTGRLLIPHKTAGLPR